MKKSLILLIAFIPLLFTSCTGLWGNHEEDIMTSITGNFYAEGKYLKNTNVFFEGSEIVVDNETFNKPYIYAVWKNLDGVVLITCPDSSMDDCSFSADCFITKNPQCSKHGQELMDNSVFIFTYYPEEGSPVEVSFNGNELKSYNNYNIDFMFTIDFDNKAFYPDDLR